MKNTAALLALTSLTLLSFADNAHAAMIEFGPATANPNATASANTGAYGSDAVVSVGYSEYTYNYASGYGGLNGGTGAAIYADNSTETLIMTFAAAAGSTVTLDSFNLAQYSSYSYPVDISVTGGSPSYSVTDVPAGGSGNYTTYSPGVTGSSLTLTITNLYDVGINEISFSEATAVPEPGSLALMSIGIAGLAGWRLRNRKPAGALSAL